MPLGDCRAQRRDPAIRATFARRVDIRTQKCQWMGARQKGHVTKFGNWRSNFRSPVPRLRLYGCIILVRPLKPHRPPTPRVADRPTISQRSPNLAPRAAGTPANAPKVVSEERALALGLPGPTTSAPAPGVIVTAFSCRSAGLSCAA